MNVKHSEPVLIVATKTVATIVFIMVSILDILAKIYSVLITMISFTVTMT